MTIDPGVSDTQAVIRRRGMAAAAIAAATIMFLAAVLRQEGVPKLSTLWAEDGAVFLQCGYLGSPLVCVGQAYQGYLHIVPRLISLVAVSLPPSAVAATIGLLAALVAALAAAVVAWSIADLTRSPLAGVIGASGLALVWQAGREVLGNTANLHWVLVAATLVAIGCAWLGGRISMASIALAVAACLTSGFAPVVVLAGGIAALLRRPRAATLCLASGAATAIQLAIELTTARSAAGTTPIPLRDVTEFMRHEVIRNGFFGDVPLAVGLVVPALLVATLIGLVVATTDRRRTARTIAVVLAMVGAGLGLCVLSILVNRALNPRYAYLPAAMTIAALGVAAGILARDLAGPVGRFGRAAPAVLPVVAIILGIGFGASFRLESRASAGPDVPSQIAEAAAHCSQAATATIFISPRPASSEWLVRIPCELIAP